jgi:predicted dienelactone hydrolase
MSSTSQEPRDSSGEAVAPVRHRQPTRPGVAPKEAGIRPRVPFLRRFRTLLLGPAVAVLVLLALLVRLGPFAFEMVEGDGAATATGLQLDGAPYSVRGPYQVGTRDLVIGSERSLTASLWYPTQPVADRDPRLTYAYELKLFAPLGTVAIATHEGQATRNTPYDLSAAPYPLVVLSPGYAIGSTSYAWLAEHLASYGLVVISPEPDEDLNPARIWRSTITRPQDIRNLLAYVDQRVGSGAAFEGLIDRSRLAVIGHSYGGYTALAAAGARLDTDAFESRCRAEYAADGPNTWLCDALVPHLAEMAQLAGLDDAPAALWPGWAAPGVDAIVSMAGDAYLFDEAGLAEISVPVMAIGGTSDTDTPFTWGTQLTYEFASSSKKAEVALRGAGHMIFTGPCDRMRRILKIVPGGFCSDSGWDRNRAQALIRHFTTAFLLAELKGDSAAAAALAPTGVDFRALSYKAEGYSE